MRRTLLLTTAGAAVVASVIPALAAPAPVDSGSAAETTLVVPLSHGDALQLDLQAVEFSGGDVVRIVAQHCAADGSCDSLDVYQGPTSSSAFSVDSSTTTADLKVVVSGHQVQLRWRPDGGVGTASGGDTAFGQDGVSDNEYQGQYATVTASIDGQGCTTTGVVGSETAVDTSAVTGGPGTADVSALRLPADATISCG